MKRYAWRTVLVALVLCSTTLGGRAAGQEAFFRSPEQIEMAINELASSNQTLAIVHDLARTPGGRKLLMLQLGQQDFDGPAVLVVANMEGNYPLASEAAIELVGLLLGDWKDELETRRWYILPMGNPDGYARFHATPLSSNTANDRPFNGDHDDATDEDGPEDLNGDGYITKMRQVHPEGTWMEVEATPTLLKKADTGKGEKGVYRLFTEGIDNDGDGKINEDGLGGVIPGRNFPHNFEHYTSTNGRWAASETESRSLLRFAFDRPQIAMVLTLGRTNSLMNVPESKKKAEATQKKYKLPKRFAKQMGMDPEQEFPIKELVEMARDFTGYKELTEEMVLMFLGVGAAVNPDRKDLSYLNEISTRYNDFLKEVELEEKRLKPPGFSPGSFEEWAYYQYGVPSFSMDFWTLPVKKEEEKKKEGDEKEEDKLTPDKIEKMSNEEFIRKEKKKKEAGGADETDDALYAFNKDAFVAWQPYDHPTLGEVEIGGRIPFSHLAPPPEKIKPLLDKQLPFVRQLVALLPDIHLDKVEIKPKGTDVWRVKAWVVNRGFLPYPTHQGQRCKRPTPVVVTISGDSVTLLEGRKRVVLGLLGGSGGVEKVTWLVHGQAGAQVTVDARTFSAGKDQKVVTLNEGDHDE